MCIRAGTGRAESRLPEALGLALTADTLASLPGAGGFGDDIVSRGRATGLRGQVARRFHNDPGTDVRRVRRQWAGKWVRLGGDPDMRPTRGVGDAAPPRRRSCGPGGGAVS